MAAHPMTSVDAAQAPGPEQVLEAREALRGQVAATPLLHSRTLSTIAGCAFRGSSTWVSAAPSRLASLR